MTPIVLGLPLGFVIIYNRLLDYFCTLIGISYTPPTAFYIVSYLSSSR